MIRGWRNLPEVHKYMFTDHQISPDEHDRWFRTVVNSPHNRYWIVVYDNEDIGLANIYDVDERNKRCYWGRYIAAPDLRGKGIGTYVEYWMLQYVFDMLQMNKLCTQVLAFNEVVLKMHKRFGFHQEGLLREHIFKGGQPYDVVALAMLRNEWEEKKSELKEHVQHILELNKITADLSG
jgi:UDP-4-amino-4,6-dideoxy-N-acetyl-beta-L-altrosamine N-acetyltransferase